MPLRSRAYGLYVLVLLTLANFFHYGNRNILFPVYQDLRDQFGFSNEEIGLLGTAFMTTHALMTLPFGWAGDRYSRQRVIAWGVALWSVASLASAAATGLGSMLLSRALVGVGTAACVPVANALLCGAFPPQDKARTVSLFNLGLFLGGAAGFGLGAGLGYPNGVLAIALPGLVLALLIARLDVPTPVGPSRGSVSRLSVRQVGELLQVPTLRWVMLGTMLMAFAAGGYTAWFFDFITMDVAAGGKGLAPDAGLVVFGLALVGGLLGVLAGGVVADRLQRRVVYGRLAAISLGMGCTVPCALASIYMDEGVVFYLMSWLTMFFITWYHGPMAAVIDDLARRDRATTAQALVIFVMHFLGTAPSSWLVGKLADRVGLREALVLPTVLVLVAALVLTGGWRTIAADRARASEPAPGAT